MGPTIIGFKTKCISFLSCRTKYTGPTIIGLKTKCFSSLFSVAGQSVYLLSIILIRDLQIKIHIFFYEKIKIHIGTNGVREVAHAYYSIKMIQPKRKKRHQHTRFSQKHSAKMISRPLDGVHALQKSLY